MMKIKIFKFFLPLLLLFGGLITPQDSNSQTHFSAKEAYTRSYGENRTFMYSYYNAWGQYCQKWKRMVWTQHTGYRQVRVWNYNTGQWYYQWQQGTYWTYYWHFYNICR